MQICWKYSNTHTHIHSTTDLYRKPFVFFSIPQSIHCEWIFRTAVDGVGFPGVKTRFSRRYLVCFYGGGYNGHVTYTRLVLGKAFIQRTKEQPESEATLLNSLINHYFITKGRMEINTFLYWVESNGVRTLISVDFFFFFVYRILLLSPFFRREGGQLKFGALCYAVLFIATRVFIFVVFTVCLAYHFIFLLAVSLVRKTK